VVKIFIDILRRVLPSWMGLRLWRVGGKIAATFYPLDVIILESFFRHRIEVRPARKGIYHVRGGGEEILVPYDCVGIFDEILLGKVYERLFKVEKGDIVIEIGAHVGVFTIQAAKAVGEKGLVVAIEPDPKNMALLHENLKNHGFDNVILAEKAVSNYQGRTKLCVGPGSYSHSIVLLHSDNYVEVDVDTLDNIALKLGLKKVNFIKMDAEGAELKILHGAKKILCSPNLKLAIEEHSRYPGAPTLSEIMHYLKSQGFKTFARKPHYIYARN
jgi:FkbM family methyltransferase